MINIIFCSSVINLSTNYFPKNQQKFINSIIITLQFNSNCNHCAFRRVICSYSKQNYNFNRSAMFQVFIMFNEKLLGIWKRYHEKRVVKAIFGENVANVTVFFGSFCAKTHAGCRTTTPIGFQYVAPDGSQVCSNHYENSFAVCQKDGKWKFSACPLGNKCNGDSNPAC